MSSNEIASRTSARTLPAAFLTSLFLPSMVLFGCGGDEPPAMTTADLGVAAPPDLSPGPRGTMTADEAEAARGACSFKRGTLPGLSFGKDEMVGPEIPIDTIVVLMFENRSFDHLFGNLAKYGQPDADVPKGGESNPDADGNAVPFHHMEELCFDDTSHSWNNVHIQVNGGKMDGFVKTNAGPKDDPKGTRAMGYYDETDIPYLYGLASTFAIGDRHFCDVLGPTLPNREYLYAATSFGRIQNDVFSDVRDNVMDLLDRGSVEWRIYAEGPPGLGTFLESFTRHFADRYDQLPGFYAAAAEGTLPSVVFLDPNLGVGGGERDDLHPPGDVQMGEKFLADVVDALMKSPQWPRLALFVTFDEHGGLYDHVAPPKACPPDDDQPMLGPNDVQAKFDNYGIRVPFLVISPWAKPHFVSHRTTSNASILRFIEARFVLPALTARDANSNIPIDMFDFTKASFATPPKLPAQAVDQAKLDACKRRFVPSGI